MGAEARHTVLDEAILSHQVQEGFLGDKVIGHAVLLAGARSPRGVLIPSQSCVPARPWWRLAALEWDALTGNGEPKGIGILGKQPLEQRTLARARGAEDHDRSACLDCTAGSVRSPGSGYGATSTIVPAVEAMVDVQRVKGTDEGLEPATQARTERYSIALEKNESGVKTTEPAGRKGR